MLLAKIHRLHFCMSGCHKGRRFPGVRVLGALRDLLVTGPDMAPLPRCIPAPARSRATRGTGAAPGPGTRHLPGDRYWLRLGHIPQHMGLQLGLISEARGWAGRQHCEEMETGHAGAGADGPGADMGPWAGTLLPAGP